MGKLRHRAIDNAERGSVTYSIWRDDANTHEINDVAGIEVVRSATTVIACSDSQASSKAEADRVLPGASDEVTYLAAINALP